MSSILTHPIVILKVLYFCDDEIRFFTQHLRCHPELAGVGVEYCWGMSKKNYRRNNAEIGASGCNQKNLTTRVIKALRTVELTNVRAFSRRTRRYRQAYCDADERVSQSFESIEKFVKLHKCHRNILDQEYRFLNDQLLVARLCHAT